MKKNVDNFHLS